MFLCPLFASLSCLLVLLVPSLLIIMPLYSHTKALFKSSGEILETIARRTGWTRDDADKSYRETIHYRQPEADDLESDTWMDIVNRRGKPWIRNIGFLR